jgi:hypothetical protein
MKQLLTLCIGLLGYAAFGQNYPVPVDFEDSDLELYVLEEHIREDGSLWFCIGKNGDCIMNLLFGYTVRIYDAEGTEIWNSIWTGRTTDIRFAKPLPSAERIEIKAVAPFVVNTLTTSRIGTIEPLLLVHRLELKSGS